jgi:acetyl esterase/lipase
MKKLFFLNLFLFAALSVSAQKYRWARDISYSVKEDAYARERLKLDVYYPEGRTDCPVVIWFHGGGLEAGQKEVPRELQNKEYVVVGVNYRLLPKVHVSETLDDAAEAVAWVFRHVADYGGSPRKVFVTGHSAGGYLSMILCLNKAWLAKYKVDADSVAAYIPFSGQAITHYNVRKMQGIQPLQPTIDEFAPLYWVRSD